MNLNDFAVGAIESAKWLTTMGLDGLTDEEMMFQPKPALNHPTWMLGHIIESANGLILAFCKGEGILPAGWHKKFGIGSKPSAKASDYPPRQEMLELLEKVHAAAVDYVKSLDPADLDRRPAHIDHLPEPAQQLFATVGKCIYGHVTHAASHAGQIATLRRLMGKPPRV
jgi:hypothetical protein